MSMSIVVDGVLAVIDSHIKTLDNQELKKGSGSMAVTEFYTEFLA